MKIGEKRAQVSVFIIIAIIILVIIVSFFLLNFTDIKSNEEIYPDILPVYLHVQNCVNKVGEESIYYIGETGGYLEIPEPSLDNIAFYLHDGKNYMPSKEKIEEQLSFYMDFMLPFCILDFEELPDFQINFGEIKTKTFIEEQKVVFDIEYPLSIKKGENSYFLKNFNMEIHVKLGVIYDSIKEYMDVQMNKTDSVCASCLYSLGEKNELNFHVLDTNESNILLFIARDENIKILGEDYHFYFANKLDK
ncbi:hypothetical protein J4221_05960 [Candidatus Pacearchaeota archaeon]|nr:hypothetical protein [Candidatus Pacearchaeota archaeon]